MPFEPVKLNDGSRIPSIGFGTASLPTPHTADYISQAIDAGFGHIDTSQNYGTEEAVGQAIKESGLSRGKGVRQSCEESLGKMGLEYVDLYLIHDPDWITGSMADAWREMEGLVKDGKAKSIGVSNFLIHHLQELLQYATIKPVVNQIELHPYVLASTEPLLEYMRQHDIALEAFYILDPLTKRPGGLVDKPLNAIAYRLDKAPEQILLAWAKAKGAIVLSKSTKKERLEGYLEAGNINLSEEDVQAIDRAGKRGERNKKVLAAGYVVLKMAAVMALGYYSLFYLRVIPKA